MADNPFVLQRQEYTRDLNFIQHYVQDVAKYLSTMTGDSVDKCREFVVEQIKPGGVFELQDPRIVYLERNEYGDRVEKHGTLMGYLRDSIANKELIAPTLTTYLPVEQKQSILVEFVDENVAIRSKAKKEMFAAKMAGDTNMENFKNSEQSNAKISNNSISGAHVSTSTPLYNKTAHSTLTSNCRSTSGFGNANNEKMLSGNRHYHHPNIVYNNIISISNRTDMNALQMVMDKWQLHYPSAEEAFECAMYSSRLYWRAKKHEQGIKELLQKLTALERAAFVYVGDLYHLAKYNDAVVRDLVGSLSKACTGEYAEPLKVIKSIREEYTPLAVQLLPGLMKGVDWKKLDPVVDENAEDKLAEQERAREHHSKLCALAATVENIEATILRFADFIGVFFVSKNVPASLAFFPTSIRRAALTSDTDSTIFTVQDWVKWKTGRLVVDEETNAVAATMIFLAAEAITHILARMSANFGITTARIHNIAMKNEYKFDVFVPTSVGKHYFAYIGCQEGNLYAEYDMEIKGVHLKSSNVPAVIMKKAEKMMASIMDSAARGEQISVKDKLHEIALIEKEIYDNALRGDSDYYRSLGIRSPDSYKGELSQSPYAHHILWKKVFAQKYGEVDEPPYTTYKVPVNLPNPNAIKAWIDSIEDPQMRAGMKSFIEETGKKSINTIQMPQQRIQAVGIPKEVVPILDLRRTILDCTAVFYLIMETLGYYCLDKKISALASDYYIFGPTDEPDLISACQETTA